ncbi:MAG: TonB-dependent receptor [Terracidiphilus sp.]
MRQFQLKAIIRLQLPVIALSISPLLAAQSPPQSPPASPSTQPAPDAKPAPITNIEQVTVTAYRAPLGVLESPVTTRLLTQQSLRSAAGVTFDDQLRQLPGVELFRRSSSLVANPTSQGISLRALGSTSASRTLVTEDDVPLNDPLGGWIHWQEQPELSIKDVELVRGGASDLYGSSAIGGVVNIVPARPSSNGLEVRSTFGGEGTYDNSLLASAHSGPWNLLAAGGLIGTDGYIQEAPSQRGPVDVPSNVHSQNALILASRDIGSLKLFVRGTGFDESRHNGTPYQINATRLIRYSTGADWQNARSAALVFRLYGSSERYRQTFSSISNLPDFGDAACTYRCGETPSKFSYVPDNELGAAAHWSRPFGAGLLLIVGADAHDVRVWDREQSYTGAAALTNLADHQRDSAAYPEAMWEHKAWTIVASSRMDWFQNYDGHETEWNGSLWTPTPAQPPQRDERIFDPRLGLSRKLSPHWALTASGFRAFRAPTPSELYRSTQVGSQLTLPNGNLLSERATGRKPVSPPSAPGAASAPAISSPRSIAPSPPSPLVLPVPPFCSCAKTSARSRAAASLSISSFDPAPGSPSTAAISTRTPWSLAARRTSAIGFPKLPAIWPPSTCARPGRLSEPSASKVVSAVASLTTTPTTIFSTVSFASTPTPRTTSASASSSSPPAKISSTAPSRFPRPRPPPSASRAQPAPASLSTSAAQANEPLAARPLRIIPIEFCGEPAIPDSGLNRPRRPPRPPPPALSNR